MIFEDARLFRPLSGCLIRFSEPFGSCDPCKRLGEVAIVWPIVRV